MLGVLVLVSSGNILFLGLGWWMYKRWKAQQDEAEAKRLEAL